MPQSANDRQFATSSSRNIGTMPFKSKEVRASRRLSIPALPVKAGFYLRLFRERLHFASKALDNRRRGAAARVGNAAMDKESIDYFLARERVERQAAKVATTPSVRRAHLELAQGYAALARRG